MNPADKINEMVEGLSKDIYGYFPPSDFKDGVLKSELCEMALVGVLAVELDILMEKPPTDYDPVWLAQRMTDLLYRKKEAIESIKAEK